MKIVIKNMVCDRCILAVSDVLRDLAIPAVQVIMGEVDTGELELTAKQMEQLRVRLESLGFALIDNRKHKIVEKVKGAIQELVHRKSGEMPKRISNYLSDKLHYDYNYLSNLFSSVEGVTIEQYLIHHKIEKAKELLFYGEVNLTSIALDLGYSSLAHFSQQFKKVTGLTPSEFKRNKNALQRLPLDKV